MKKLFLASFATLFLVAGTAQAEWLPQQETKMPTEIAGNWCLFSKQKARSDLPLGRSEHYKTQDGCSNMNVSESGFDWPGDIVCRPTHVSTWWKNSKEWSAWRILAVCSGNPPLFFEFEFIYSCPEERKPNFWPSLIISTPPFIPDKVRNEMFDKKRLLDILGRVLINRPSMVPRPESQ